MWLSATPSSPGAGAASSYAHEWPSVWCMLSVAQVALALVREAALSSGKSGQAARAAKKAALAAKAGIGKGAVAIGATAGGGGGQDALRRRRA